MKPNLFPRNQTPIQQWLHAESLLRMQRRDHRLAESPGSLWWLLAIVVASFAIGVLFVTAF